MKLRAMVACAVTLILTACNGDDGVVGTGSGGTDTPLTISGAAQKGPFIIGSEVLMSQLQSDGAPTANTSLTEISDNLGNFKSYVTKSGPVLITADGYHFNEITGKLSQGRLLLKAIYNATSEPDQHAFINILTHLAYKRTLKLLGQGMAVADAVKQAESEVVNAFKPVLPVSGVTDFTALNIYDVDTRLSYGNAYALALSATIYQYAMLKQKQSLDTSVDAQLTDILNNLADDLAGNGTITSTVVITALVQATRLLRPDQIRKNLEDRSFDVSGTKLPVANIDLFIDTDGDGKVNAEDPDDDNDGIPDELDPSPYVYSEAPVLIKPDVTNALPSKQEILFEWSSSDYAKNFEIQISKNADFATTIVSQLTPGKTFAVTLDAGVYYIRARSENVYGFLGAWSSTKQFGVGVFTKTYGSSTENATKMIQTSDGGYAIVGTTTSGWVQNGAVLLLRLDALGNLLWNKTFDTHYNDVGINLIQSSDGGFLLATLTYTSLNTTFKLIKTDSSGIYEWSTVLEYPSWNVQMLSEADGFVLCSSWTTVQSKGLSTPSLIKIDNNGSTLWSYQFDESNIDFEDTVSMTKLPNGDYVITGNYQGQNEISNTKRPFFARLSEDRTSFTYFALPPGDVGLLKNAAVGSDASVTMVTNMPNPYFFEKYLENGTKLWRYVPTNWLYSSNFTPVITSTGQTTIGGETYNGDQYILRLITLHDDGYLLRSREHIFLNYFFRFDDIVAASDGGFTVLGGKNTSDNQGAILLIKTDAEGNVANIDAPLHTPLE